MLKTFSAPTPFRVDMDGISLPVMATFILLALLGCGRARASNFSPIINGQAVDSTHQFPWQVALFYSTSDVFQSQYCGGTLIDSQWIATAAHCADSKNQVYVAAGITDLSNTAGGQIRKVAHWYVHPGYDSKTLDNDIALAQLDSPIDMAACGDLCKTISPVTQAQEPYVMPVGSNALVSGWGTTTTGGNGTFPYVLQWAQVQIMSCTQNTSFSSTDTTGNMVCAGTANYSTDACSGDSGGPLVVANSEGTGYLLAGLVSWGNGCAVSGYPGVYTRVANYVNWIDSVEHPPTTKKKGGALDFWVLVGMLGMALLRGPSRTANIMPCQGQATI